MSSIDGPSAAVRARLLAAAAREPATPPGTWWRRAVLGGLLAVAWMTAILGVIGLRSDLSQLPNVELSQTLVTLVAVALLASAAGLARGRSMVGVTTESLSATAWGLPILLLVLVLLVDPRGSLPMKVPNRLALVSRASGCDLLTFAIAVPLIGIGVWFSRGRTLGRPGLTGACIGLAAATWSHLLIRVHCAVGGAGHAVIGHLLPALPLMAMGACVTWLIDHRRSGLRKNTL